MSLGNKAELGSYPSAGNRAVETRPEEKVTGDRGKRGKRGRFNVKSIDPPRRILASRNNRNDFVPIPYKHTRTMHQCVRSLTHK
jgi:hypothetical protein